MNIDDMEISTDFKVRDWNALILTDGGDGWDKAIEVFKNRISSRFIEPADILIMAHSNDSSKKVGFAVLILDFIVIETLQAFIDGIKDGDGRNLFVSFVCDKENERFFGQVDEKVAHRIYSKFRNSISHQGQTDGNFRVKASGDIIATQQNGYDITINRTKLHEAVKDAFLSYCSELNDPKNQNLREKMLKKMNAICGKITC